MGNVRGVEEFVELDAEEGDFRAQVFEVSGAFELLHLAGCEVF